MKKLIPLFLAVVMLFTLAACGETDVPSNTSGELSNSTTANTNNSDNTDDPQKEDDNMNTKKILVAYFSRADENYGVGYIEKGNTRIIAEMIAEQVGGELFEIKRVTPYPADYNSCIAEAQAEKNVNARPDITATVGNFDDYGVVFLG